MHGIQMVKFGGAESLLFQAGISADFNGVTADFDAIPAAEEVAVVEAMDGLDLPSPIPGEPVVAEEPTDDAEAIDLAFVDPEASFDARESWLTFWTPREAPTEESAATTLMAPVSMEKAVAEGDNADAPQVHSVETPADSAPVPLAETPVVAPEPEPVDAGVAEAPDAVTLELAGDWPEGALIRGVARDPVVEAPAVANPELDSAGEWPEGALICGIAQGEVDPGATPPEPAVEFWMEALILRPGDFEADGRDADTFEFESAVEPSSEEDVSVDVESDPDAELAFEPEGDGAAGFDGVTDDTHMADFLLML